MFIHLDLGWWAHPFALSSFMITSQEQIDQIRGLGKRQFRWSPEKSRPLDTPSTVTPGTLPAGDARPDVAVPQDAPGAVVPAAAAAAAAAATPATPVAAPAASASPSAAAPTSGAAAAPGTAAAARAPAAAPVPAADGRAAGTPAATARASTAPGTATGGGAVPPSTSPTSASPAGTSATGTSPGGAEPRSGRAEPAAATPTADARGEHKAEPIALERVRQRAALSQQREAQALCQRQVAEARDAWAEAARHLARQPQQSREIAEGLTRALLDKMMVDQDMCVRVLSDAACDPVAGHALNVAVVSMLMGRVFGFSADDMMDMGVGALMHDIGKFELPERARYDDDRCGPSEQALYRDHVAHGVAQGKRLGLSDGALLVIAQHHEMADASGFPQRLILDRMSGPSRIVALVNRYDNLCNPRQAAHALTPHEALSLIFAQCKTKFDASMLNAFVRMMGVYPPGSVVQLTDDRYASVVSVNSTRPLKPRVMVCDPAVPPDEALLLSLDREHNLGIRRSLKPAQLPSAVRDYLQPQQRMVYFFEPLASASASPAEELAA
ncbi:HD-GYP domain-containing protein [Pseudaquabacterium inlustre]